VLADRQGFQVAGDKCLGYDRAIEIAKLPFNATYDLACRAAEAAPDAEAIYMPCARMPVVARWVAEAFGQDPLCLAEPELTVVSGASRWLGRAGRHTIPAEELPPGVAPLSFPVPGGRARLVRWLVAPGERYPAGAVLARIRMPGGGLWDLTASTDGTLTRHLVEADGEVGAGQWLALSV
jgi:hypothetical protein